MRSLKILHVALALSAMTGVATAQQPKSLSEVVDKIVSQEQAEVQLLRQYSPLVETYIQNVRPDKQMGTAPDGDRYFLGRADLANGLELESLNGDSGVKYKLLRGWAELFTTEYIPRGFLQMIYVDMYDFDRMHYNIEYVDQEFLGEVRCLVFDVDPLPKTGKGRFVGRIWVEDQDYHIVRFNGAYGGSSLTSGYYNFDSWRTSAGKNLWLPSFIYSEEVAGQDRKAKNLGFKGFKAQTRLWGYDIHHTHDAQVLSKVLVEGQTPVRDQTENSNDYSPLQSIRSWSRQAEDNIISRLERQGLIAPYGEVDKVLVTVVNNLEVTNNLEIQPEVRCRVLMTSTLESFTIGHTIVLSRGLVDVLPNEASLAAMLAHELGHVVLGHRVNTQFAFLNHLRFDEKETFQHFGFAHTQEEELAAKQKGIELLKNSPYKEQSGTTELFLVALKKWSKEIPNLISSHLGDRVPIGWAVAHAVFAAPSSEAKPATNVIAALPLGGRIKIDPWNDQLRMLKSKPVGVVAEAENIPFQITPFIFYLTRREGESSSVSPAPVTESVNLESRP